MVGFTNTMSYGKLTLNFSFDACIGGKMLSQYNRYMWAGGRSLDIDDQARKDWYAGKDYLAQGVNVISGTLERDGDGNVISDTRQFAPNTKIQTILIIYRTPKDIMVLMNACLLTGHF